MKRAIPRPHATTTTESALSRAAEARLALHHITDGMKIPERRPLTGYELPRAAEREAYRAIPSWKP